MYVLFIIFPNILIYFYYFFKSLLRQLTFCQGIIIIITIIFFFFTVKVSKLNKIFFLKSWFEIHVLIRICFCYNQRRAKIFSYAISLVNSNWYQRAMTGIIRWLTGLIRWLTGHIRYSLHDKINPLQILISVFFSNTQNSINVMFVIKIIHLLM